MLRDISWGIAERQAEEHHRNHKPTTACNCRTPATICEAAAEDFARLDWQLPWELGEGHRLALERQAEEYHHMRPPGKPGANEEPADPARLPAQSPSSP